ncbi:hypothetical protein L1987_01734 [Smallanthus sonchifolius]|uniref:Uncharacterized protein n=1 Tax=Smallanthus sonchifolius TaxID=185202 RepID=A0ACB9K5W3_9ASTR|nr:hypothetical protein L1987_01734 [Smallanthus sonchifolius]
MSQPKPSEDKSSQLDFTASMMIEYEIKEAKMLMDSNPTFDETPQTNKPSMEENSQSYFTASMIVEYDQQENEILKDRQQREEGKLKEMSQPDFIDSMIMEYDKQEKEILKDRKKEAEKVEESAQLDFSVSPIVEVVSMGEKRTILENNISPYLFSGYVDEWDEVFNILGKCDMPRFMMETLRPGQYLHINAIQTWAHILNHEEKFRSKDSIARLFSTRLMLDVDDVDMGEDDEVEPDHYVYEVKRHT